MKHSLWLVCLLFLAATCRNNEKSTSIAGNTDSARVKSDSSEYEYKFNKEKPYPYESGIIKYKYTGGYEGTQTIYFKNFGQFFRVEDDYVNTALPNRPSVKQVFINAPDKYYFADLNTKKGYFVKRTDTTTKLQGNLLSDFTSYGIDSTMHKNGYKRSGHEEISGKKCQVYKSGSGESQFCFWQGINIKTDMKLGNQFGYTLEAVDIKENAKVGDDMLNPPADVKIMDYKTYVKSETRDKL